jgi:micrococcal nuclease
VEVRVRWLVAVTGLIAVSLAVWLGMQLRTPKEAQGWQAVDHVADGDTIVLRGGRTVRLVQIDTPEVYFRPECYGENASRETKQLLQRGALVRLVRDRATSSTDAYHRLLRYVIREDGLNVNLRLVAEGTAAPYFFDGVRGRYADVLMKEAEAAQAAGKGLWGACPGTRLEPDHGFSTGDLGR